MHQVKQEKSGGQEQVSTSPYPTTFPEALAFPNYEAAMNQYTSVSPSQGWFIQSFVPVGEKKYITL